MKLYLIQQTTGDHNYYHTAVIGTQLSVVAFNTQHKAELTIKRLSRNTSPDTTYKIVELNGQINEV